MNILRKGLSRITGIAARLPLPGFLRKPLLGAFSRMYKVNLEEAAHPLGHYRSFQDFFTRELKSGARPIDSNPEAVVSPVDGYCSLAGKIEQGTLIQAKGLDYSLEELLAGDKRQTDFLGGNFLTLYLSPADCHRIYAPIDLKITDTKHVPGTLYPVHARSVGSTERLFARNERLIFYLETNRGPAVLIMVGALNVGSMKTTAPLQQDIKKGDEISMFLLGSTVILLFPSDQVKWETLATGEAVRIGRKIGGFLS